MEIYKNFTSKECGLRSDLLKQGLEKLFKKLENLFEAAMLKITNGTSIDSMSSEINEYIGYERRITVNLILKEKYK
jgi:hypothetical protein